MAQNVRGLLSCHIVLLFASLASCTCGPASGKSRSFLRLLNWGCRIHLSDKFRRSFLAVRLFGAVLCPAQQALLMCVSTGSPVFYTITRCPIGLASDPDEIRKNSGMCRIFSRSNQFHSVSLVTWPETLTTVCHHNNGFESKLLENSEFSK